MADEQNRNFRENLPEERLENRFGDVKKEYENLEATIEAQRCLGCFDAPCISACPTGINIPQFISRIAQENIRGAAKTILSANVFGESCGRVCPTEVLCEGACVYHRLNKRPIGIGKLQQFAVKSAYNAGYTFFKPGTPTGKIAALLGAGPASIACAHQLRLLGHEVVIFEKTSLPGGLNTNGIAPYKMKADVSLDEIEQISSIGIRYEFNRELGVNLDMASLLREYDAIFLGLGLGPDHLPAVEGLDGPDLTGKQFGAVEFIANLKTELASIVTKRLSSKSGKTPHSALVVGGGNTALDTCRELRRLGVPKVLLSYRRSELEMSGYAHELSHARAEGVETLFNSLPFRMQSSGNQVQVFLKHMPSLGATAEDISLEVDLVFFATGQTKLEDLLTSTEGLSFKNGRLLVDEKTGQTGNAKIFAGGDLTNGGLEVVNAVAEGKRGAFGIHQFLIQEKEAFIEESNHV